jgi:hypothetical protein
MATSGVPVQAQVETEVGVDAVDTGHGAELVVDELPEHVIDAGLLAG